MSDSPVVPKVSRRLAAILAADIAGYSALMSADEEATVRDLKGHQAVILPMAAEHGGRIIDTAGDGILGEFGSVLSAVKCALAIQKTMAERNTPVEASRRMQFRIGINQGDVVVDDAHVFGDGVNIAAWLEAIADPGGICISDKVYQEIRGKVAVRFQDLGPQQLKNIPELVHVYRIEPHTPSNAAPLSKPALNLPDKPSIAVLPFTNLSGDPKEDYFSDGITEDIITELSRFSELFVIARNSSFQYKSRFPDLRQAGRELGVRYILEGSIRRSGDRVRVTSQLVDAATGAHRWAERYDRKLADVFSVQDEVARTIVTILAAHVNKAEVERTLLKAPATWQGYDYYMRAADIFNSYFSSFKAEELYEVRRFLQHALALDPNYARAHSMLSKTFMTAWIHRLDGDYLNPLALDRALVMARKAVQLDPTLPDAHVALGVALCFMHEHEPAIAELERALALNPNFTDWRFATILVFAGHPARGIEMIKAHMRMDPFYAPLAPHWLGYAHYMLKQYSEALPAFRESLSRAPTSRAGQLLLAATYAQLGRVGDTRTAAAEALRIDPNYTIEGTTKRIAVFKHEADVEHLFDGLRKAGLPAR